VMAFDCSCFYHPCVCETAWKSLTFKAVKMLVYAFIASYLDYCNSWLAAVSSGLLSKLHSIQNTATQLVTMTMKFDHINLVVHDLHWLLVCRRIKFAVATLLCKWLAPL
jgi:small-conductance mechanosensitive channel